METSTTEFFWKVTKKTQSESGIEVKKGERVKKNLGKEKKKNRENDEMTRERKRVKGRE